MSAEHDASIVLLGVATMTKHASPRDLGCRTPARAKTGLPLDLGSLLF